ncbi:MAG: Ig-like domain-containing protein [Actinomycetota bacterium]|nr:Ig-like domain-containing protein [Actinomycetota bacterium]
MRRSAALVLTGLLLAALAVPSGNALAGAPPEMTSPPGQITLVTINAKQWAVLGVERFTALFELVRALRRRVPAFDGGAAGGVTAPDVVVVQEMRPSNLEIFKHLMRQRFSRQYEVFGPEDLEAAFLYNAATVTPQGDAAVFADVCEPDTHSYPIGRFIENATNQPFTIAGVHFSRHYTEGGDTGCLYRNVQALRLHLANALVPTFIAGDFNKRPVTAQLECDPNELSTPLSWWSALAAPSDGGTPYADSVRTVNRATATTMLEEWTHERFGSSSGCDGAARVRRGRIDYIFAASATVAEAHADHPGWAGGEPGTKSPDNYKYSDHRFVWGRFIISGPAQPAPPTTTLGADGLVTVTWTPVEGATGYVVYRAREGRAYRELARVTAEVTTYADLGARHGVPYRYSIAAIGPDTSQGLESAGTSATPDAVGPSVDWTRPPRDATGVDPDVVIEVHFDERVDPDSVASNTITVRREDGTLIPGAVSQTAPRVVVFDPNRPLRQGESFRVVVRSVEDALGNEGTWHFFSFRTEPPPPKPRRR